MNFNRIILLKGTFNYFNRKIYFYSNPMDYINIAEDYLDQADINFNPNDGVTASLIVNAGDINYFDYSYLLVVDNADNIISRWYILDATRNLSGQFTLNLRRDVVAESIASVDFTAGAPVYVEKGILPEEDPMIVNDEGLTFNQIKKEEILIKRKIEYQDLAPTTGAGQRIYYNEGFIVGYFHKGKSFTGTSPDRTPYSGEYLTMAQLAAETGIDENDLIAMLTGKQYFATSKFKLTYATYTGVLGNCDKVDQYIPNDFSSSGDYNYNVERVLAWTGAVAGHIDDGFQQLIFYGYIYNYLKNNSANIKAAIQSAITAEYQNEKLYTLEQYNKLLSYEGTVILYGGEYRKLIIKSKNSLSHPELTIDKGENSFFDSMISGAVSATAASGVVEYDNWNIFLNYTVMSVDLELEAFSEAGYFNINIPSSANTLKDAPYSIFVIPYSNYAVSDLPSGYSANFAVKGEIALDIANTIATGMDANLIDIQILPYCPDYERFFKSTFGITYRYDRIALNGLIESQDFSIITKGTETNKASGIILFPTISRFSFTTSGINISMKRDSRKIESQTDFYRLCAPNWNGIFEFNLAKMGGTIDHFIVDCMYKPFNPFIKVAPEFNFLYGINYNDGRGLICGGDYSLSIIKDEWIHYELTNKNYSMAFSRDIVDLEFAQRQERFKEPFTVAAGAIGAGAAGAVSGFKLSGGNPYATAAGAAVGATAGIVGGALDMKLAEERRVEAKDYQIEKFNLALGNIKALPRSLAKTSVLSQTFRIFPVLEYYTCTDEEVEALKNKIKFDGMRVGRIDYITKFMGGNDNQKFFKGQLIRALGIYENEDFINALYNELAKGVYI